MLDRIAQFLAHDLTREQVNAVMRVGWRVGMIGFVAWATGAFAGYGAPGFARADEATTIKSSVAQLSGKVERWRAEDRLKSAEAELAAVDREIFSIEARLAEFGRLGQTADALYTQRLAELRIRRGNLARRVERAEKDPDLAGPDEG